MSRILRRCALSATVLALFNSVNSSAIAQQTPTPPPPANVQVVTRPVYVESAVVVLLMAGAGYAVCRSSRR